MCMVIIIITEILANDQSHCKIFPHNWSISEIVNEAMFKAHIFVNVVFFFSKIVKKETNMLLYFVTSL